MSHLLLPLNCSLTLTRYISADMEEAARRARLSPLGSDPLPFQFRMRQFRILYSFTRQFQHF
jgi:hypothetical protein